MRSRGAFLHINVKNIMAKYGIIDWVGNMACSGRGPLDGLIVATHGYGPTHRPFMFGFGHLPFVDDHLFTKIKMSSSGL